MKIVLKNAKTKCYLLDGDQWTTRPEVAHRFPTGAEALRHCMQRNLMDMEIVYEFDDPHFNIRVPMSDLAKVALAKN